MADARVFGKWGGRELMDETQIRRTEPGLTWVGGDCAWDDLDETSRKILAASVTGTSIFDPVLCELAYRWFCPPGGLVLDPFAGGSVRGVVASKLGRRYAGVELRPEQKAANEAQASAICADPLPRWFLGDALDLGASLPRDVGPADLLFTCPPYGDLEVYSDDPRDLSTMSWEAFSAAHARAVDQACARLKDDRFAVWVVGDFRCPKGFYRGFPEAVVAHFAAAGLRKYNEAILVTAVGSLPVRVGKQFTVARKIGKTHQNVLVFCKGDPRKAVEAIGEVEFGDLEPAPEAAGEFGEVMA